MRGKLKHWIPLNRFGCIRRDDGAEDVFVHIKQFADHRTKPPPVGTRLEFNIGTHNGKTCAVDVRVVLE
jgi:cold shock CspA family protein